MSQLLPSYHGCFGCGRDNPIGVALQMRWDGEKVSAFFSPRIEFAGFEEVIHGGIVCTLLDEVMWWAIAAKDRKCTVTADMKVQFRHPVTTQGTYTIEGWVTKQVKSKVYTAAARVLAENGKTCAQSEARFVVLPQEEWERFLKGLTDPSFFTQYDKKDR